MMHNMESNRFVVLTTKWTNKKSKTIVIDQSQQTTPKPPKQFSLKIGKAKVETKIQFLDSHHLGKTKAQVNIFTNPKFNQNNEKTLS